MERLTQRQVMNAFVPATEIKDSDKFAGRKKYIKNSYKSLISEGNSIAVIGNRGIGKTSLSRQIINISEGKYDLLDRLDIYYDEQLNYKTIYYACGNSIKQLMTFFYRL